MSRYAWSIKSAARAPQSLARLTISRTIVEAHGGRLLVENVPAGGATFRVHLPTDQPKT